MLFLEKFRRITTSGDYLPAVDGLRFVAIFSVILFHISGNETHFSSEGIGSLGRYMLSLAHQGVELFFVISGFILARPFINSLVPALQQNGKMTVGKPVNLKSYYLRRLTRLEPPYLLALTILFLIRLAAENEGFSYWFSHYSASFFYLNNVLNDHTPKVATILWSLEVEIQFYLLAPLIFSVFALPQRRLVLYVSILVLPLVHQLTPYATNTVFKYLHFFLAGALLAELYADQGSLLYRARHWLGFVAGVIALVGLFTIEAQTHPYQNMRVHSVMDFVSKITYPFVAMVFFGCVLGNDRLCRVFSIKLLTIIGGMCYSIYLWHTFAIQIIKALLPASTGAANQGFLELQFTVACLVAAILLGAFFFLLIERPCMRSDWPIRLKAWLQARGSNLVQRSETALK